MNLDQLAKDAKERLHRSIGQRARWAHAAIAEGAKNLRSHGYIRRRVPFNFG
jgi:hypothetical protein